MNEMLDVLMRHPWLAGGVAALMLIAVLAPYEIVADARSGRVRIRALLWSLEQAPGYTRLHMPGVLRLQRATLRALGWLWGQTRDHWLAGPRELLRRWLG